MDTFTATTRILVSGNECDNSEDDGQSIVYMGREKREGGMIRWNDQFNVSIYTLNK